MGAGTSGDAAIPRRQESIVLTADKGEGCRRRYATLTEGGAGKGVVVVCGDSHSRDVWLYESQTNKIELNFAPDSSGGAGARGGAADKIEQNFLVRFEGIT